MSNKEKQSGSPKGNQSYYDADFNYREEDFPKINPSKKLPTSKEQIDLKKSNLSQSLHRVKSLFSSAQDANQTKETIKKKTFSSSRHTSDRFNDPLPTPEEIRQERERRRKLRLDQLEEMHTVEEVIKSHQPTSYSNARYEETPSSLSLKKEDQINLHKQREPFSNDLEQHIVQDQDSLDSHPSMPQKIDLSPKTETSNESADSSLGTIAESVSHESSMLNSPINSVENGSNLFKKELQFDSQIAYNHHEAPQLTSSEENQMYVTDSMKDSSSSDTETDFDIISISNINQIQAESSAPVSQDSATSESRSDQIQDMPQIEMIDVDNVIQNNSDNSESHRILLTSDEEVLDQPSETLPGEEISKRLFPSIPYFWKKWRKNQEEHSLDLSKSDSDKQQAKDQTLAPASETENVNDTNLLLLTNMSQKEKVYFSFNVFFNVLKKLVIYFILIGFLLLSLAGGIGAGYFAYLVGQTEPPTKEEMQAQLTRVDQQSKLYYADGSPIASVRADVVRTVTQLDEISPYIIDGLIATEDEYFYEHPGIIPKALLRATLQALFSSGAGTGGSTLTQQIVKQQMLTNDVTFFRKANEILLALRVENYFSKNEILTAYLNISPFGRNNNGDNIAGIYAASEGIFGKKPSEVNLAQAAFLVGLPQDPYFYSPYNQFGEIKNDISGGVKRMQEVLFRMYRTGKITKEEYEVNLNYDIKNDFQPTVQVAQERQNYLYQAMMNGAIEQIMRLNIEKQGLTWEQVAADVQWYNDFYFAAEEELRTGGYQVYTTIDKGIYDLLQETAKTYQGGLGISHDGVYTDPDTGAETYYVESVQSGVVVMDNQTGRVLGFVAGTDYENNQIDHAFGMRRSPGSTIKPLAVYGPAIEYNLINPSTMIPDTAFEMTYEDGSTWTPTNYGYTVSGNLLSARTALLRSDNLPAVRVYQQLLDSGVQTAAFLRNMGFDMVDGYTEEDTQNLAFSLGGVTKGPTVFEQTRAFTTFANNGQYIGGYYISKIEDAAGNVLYEHKNQPTQVFSEDTNYMLVDMLRDTNTQGTGRTAAANLTMGGDWIAKSGISENSRDVWYIASTPSITIGTWIGYDNRYTDYYIDINDGYGRESERIQQYWANLANALYAAYPDIFGTEQRFVQPDSVVQTQVLENTGTLPGAISINGANINMTGPLRTDVFKVTHPAPPLTYDFIFNGTESDTQNFWQTYITQVQEAQRRQREQQQNRNNSTNRVNEETTTSTSEETTTAAP